jgi:hypothetical protein
MSPVVTPTQIYLTSDTPYNYPPLPYIPSQATIEPYPSLPSITTSTPMMVAPGVVLPQYTVIQPSFPLAPSLDLDNDEESKKKIAQYFLFKLCDKWLYGSMLKLLSYLKVHGNNVDVIDNLKDLNFTSNDTQESIEKKINFIENNIFSQGDMYLLLKEFTRETNSKWADLIKNYSSFVKDKVKKVLKRKLIHIIENKKKY